MIGNQINVVSPGGSSSNLSKAFPDSPWPEHNCSASKINTNFLPLSFSDLKYNFF